jgi:hypothetical protein
VYTEIREGGMIMSLNSSAQKKPIEQMSEVELYMLINTAGYMMWRMNHDAADGRIPNEGVDESIKSIHEIQHNALTQLNKFGITPFLNDGKSPSDTYWEWFYKWDNYVKGLSNEDYDILETRINNGDSNDIKVV